MINVNVIPTLYKYLACIFDYGLKNDYSFSSIQERLSNSEMFRRLENGDSSFIYERNLTKELEFIYSTSISNDEIKDYDSKMLWLAEAYIRLFFKYHKTIFYIFLYIPLEEMLQLYSLYHEMDWTELYDLFIERTKKNKLLRKILNYKKLSINKLSQLSGVDISSIKYYCLRDENIYRASYSNIYDISYALNVNSNVFIKELHNYTNSIEYEFDKTNIKYRSILGLSTVSYFSNEINNRKYEYDEKKNCFYDGEHILKVMMTSTPSFFEHSARNNEEIKQIVEDCSKSIPKINRKKYVLVIFEYNQISESVKPFLYLQEYGYDKIFIINQESVICINTNYWISHITDNVQKALILRSKKTFGKDFAL